MSEMAKYEKNPDGKYQCPICEYGHGSENGKSRQSVTKHYNSNHAEKAEEPPLKPTESPTATIGPKDEEDPILRVDVKEGPADDFEPSTPDWFTFDMSEDELSDDPVTVSISPTASTVLRGMATGGEPPSSPKAIREFYEQQGKMMRWIFAGGVDPLISWYGKGITADENFNIKRSSSDWELFEDVSSTWLEYHGIQVPVTPDIIMAGTVLSFYAPVFAKIHKQRDPNRPTILSRWRSRRAMRKALKQQREKEMGA
tara:strand:+ start:521 stop:1288 length:768 start_codon:yes stop_codon:yes gene_type:complete